jgi:effector-binding domain-containing protein
MSDERHDTEPGPQLVTADAVTTAVIRRTVPMAELGGFYDEAFRTLVETLTRQGIAPAGPAFGLYHGAPTDRADVEAGFATAGPVEADGDVVAGSLPAGRVARLVHRGAYDTLVGSWERLHSWVVSQGLQPGPLMWELYVTEPTPDADPAALLTELNLQVDG